MLAPAGALIRLKVRVCPESLSVAGMLTLRAVVFTTLKVVCGRLSTGTALGRVRSSSTSRDRGTPRRPLTRCDSRLRRDRKRGDRDECADNFPRAIGPHSLLDLWRR